MKTTVDAKLWQEMIEALEGLILCGNKVLSGAQEILDKAKAADYELKRQQALNQAAQLRSWGVPK